jgi:hypothetical protein
LEGRDKVSAINIPAAVSNHVEGFRRTRAKEVLVIIAPAAPPAMPMHIVMPIDPRDAAPAPLANIIGDPAKMNANEVIRRAPARLHSAQRLPRSIRLAPPFGEFHDKEGADSPPQY